MRTLKLLLTILTTVIFLAACNQTEPLPAEPAAPAFVNITSGGQSDYYVIRNDHGLVKAEIEAAMTIRREINAATGAAVGIATDWEKNPVYDHEIIVGKTLRNGCEIDTVKLGETGYIIKEVDGDIYICGGAAPGMREAVNVFLEEFVKEGCDVVIPTGYERIVYHEFDIPALYVNMNQVDGDWKIVIPDKVNPLMERTAEQLQTAIARKCGFSLSVVKGDESVPNAFILSDIRPERNGIHSMHVDNNRLIFRSSASTGVSGCVQRFIDRYMSGARGRFNFPGEFEYLDLGDYMMVTYPETN